MDAPLPTIPTLTAPPTSECSLSVPQYDMWNTGRSCRTILVTSLLMRTLRVVT